MSLEYLVKIANIATPIIAIAAILYARKQIETSRIENRRIIAHTAYDNYLSLCLDKTEFSFGSEDTNSFDSEKFKKYRWFVSKMLFAFEEILEVYPDDTEWQVTIKNQLKRHKYHLSNSSSIQRREWSQSLMELIDQILASNN